MRYRTKLVTTLEEGDAIDLSEDPFVGNCTDPDCTLSKMWEFEYGIVDMIEMETPDCIRVDFTNGESIGFPLNHQVIASNYGINSVEGWFQLDERTSA